MKELSIEYLEKVNGGGAVGCAASILTTVSITLGAAAIAVGTAGAGVLILGYGLAKLGATAFIISECGDL